MYYEPNGNKFIFSGRVSKFSTKQTSESGDWMISMNIPSTFNLAIVR